MSLRDKVLVYAAWAVAAFAILALGYWGSSR